MCLYTDYKTPLISIEPIRVWKRLLPTGVVKIVKINKKRNNEIEYYRTPYKHIWVKTDDSLKALDNNAKVQELISLGCYAITVQGVHGYVTMSSAKFKKQSNEVVTEWEIPAGAKFWIGTGYSKGEIAATEMKFIKVCED